MTSARLARFKSQQAITGKRSRAAPAVQRKPAPEAQADAFDTLVAEHRAVIRSARAPLPKANEDAARLLRDLRRQWRADEGAAALADLRGQAITAVAASFGLGSVVAARDKAGGNVTTPVTARANAYADETDAYRRGDYTGSRYRSARADVLARNTDTASGRIRDAYSGKQLRKADVDCDHVVAAKTFHDDGGYMLPRERRAAFGADRGNLAPTSSKANRSLGERDKLEWGRTAAPGGGRTNKDAHQHDNRRILAAVKRGEAATQQHLPDAGTQAGYYATRLSQTGIKEAAKGGLQQALSVLMTEFLAACFDEVEDAWRTSGASANGWLDGLMTRFKRVVKRVCVRWREAWTALRAGALSAFLGNVATMLLNQLFKTAKAVTRVMRDGLLTILRSLHMLLFPPAGRDPAEARQAALSVLTAAMVSALGVAAGELLENGLHALCTASAPMLLPFVPAVAGALTALATALASCLAVRTVERLDLFGAAEKRTHRQIVAALDRMIDESDAAIEALLETEQRHLAKLEALVA
jgi:hypothetical protein